MNIKLFISMNKCKKLKLFLIALIIIVQGVHSGSNYNSKAAAFTSIRLSQEINRAYQNPNNFNYENSNESLIAKLCITVAATNILLLIIFTLWKILNPNNFNMLHMIMVAIIICFEILLTMDSCYRFYYRDDPFQMGLNNISSKTYLDLKQRLDILTQIQFGLSMTFDLAGAIIFSIQLYDDNRKWKRNPHEIFPLEKVEENNQSDEM